MCLAASELARIGDNKGLTRGMHTTFCKCVLYHYIYWLEKKKTNVSCFSALGSKDHGELLP